MATLFSDTSNIFTRPKTSLKPLEVRDASKHKITSTEAVNRPIVPTRPSPEQLHLIFPNPLLPSSKILQPASQAKSKTQTLGASRKDSSQEDVKETSGSIYHRLRRRKSVVESLKERVRGSERRLSADKTHTTNVIKALPAGVLAVRKVFNPGSVAQFQHKLWLSRSRSSSPNLRRKLLSVAGESDTIETDIISRSDFYPLSSIRSRSAGPHTRSHSPARSIFHGSRRIRRDVNISEDSFDDMTPSPASSRRSSINASLASAKMFASEIPAFPRMFSRKLTGSGSQSNREKDELWSAFRALESDYQKFISKSSASKANSVRSTLIPFLRSHMHHAANRNIRPEDLQRRIGILNKWWTGLVESIDGAQLANNDRPMVYEAIEGIMARPEWRQAPSDFASLSDRQSSHILLHKRSNTSLDLSASRGASEAIHQRVRALYMQNLLAQMGFVVEKMSQKTVSASLVNFCGKATAYAFFFCPGVADALVKIWAVPRDEIRRIFKEFDLFSSQASGDSSENGIAGFPEFLQPLGWKSLKALSEQLRRPSTLPAKASIINWHGSWVSRWLGRDSDLFFVFCKHYYILLEDFLPPDTSLAQKARAPGFVLVQCQLLSTLNATIHRQVFGDVEGGSAHIPFDDLLKGLDDPADALPLPVASNVVRIMSENRLIVLLQDFLSEKARVHHEARRTFADSISKLLQIAVKATSQFNHNSCFLICDFLEEALVIFTEFQDSRNDGLNFIDWKFWLKALQNMLESRNSITEVRVFSLLYGQWNKICEDTERKRILCLQWLLTRRTFQMFFLHWCPMVRAFYMRLLCWRVCRFVGRASNLDTVFSDNIKLVWANYLALTNSAERGKRVLPSTSACLPAPGRRLIIVRVDTKAAVEGLISCFDEDQNPSALKQENTNTSEFATDADRKSQKWSILGMITNTNTAQSTFDLEDLSSFLPTEVSKAHTTVLDQVRLATVLPRNRPPLVRRKSSSSTDGSLPPNAITSGFRALSFKFSLEWDIAPETNPSFLPTALPEDSGAAPCAVGNTGYRGERRLNPPRLPGPAHTWLVSQVPRAATEVAAKESRIGAVAEIKYAGCALAEWALTVLEHNNFLQRRTAEGVPSLNHIEVPVLGVDDFKRIL